VAASGRSVALIAFRNTPDCSPIIAVMDPYGTYVKALHYRTDVPERFTYENPAPVQFDTPAASFCLAESGLTVTLSQDHPNVPEAQAAVASALAAWELMADLQYSPGEFRFRFERGEFAHRNPPPPGIIVGSANLVQGGATVRASGTVTPPIRRAYPDPPTDFKLTLDVETMFNRLLGSIAGREPIPAAAYFCLTVIESLARGPKRRRLRAANMLAIDIAVLSKLGELSSENGGPAIGRKASAKRPLTDAQVKWLDAAVRKLIMRVGQQAAGAHLPQIGMADLPPGV
jgi:hypothetical protein